MTADERIERLVNRFGQTISDLPKPDNYKDYGNRDKLVNAMLSAERAYEEWYNPEDNSDWRDACNAYICHLCDVIDRMEAALETAALWADCTACGNISAVCGDRCICGENFRTSDGLLEGRHLNFDEPLMPVSTD